MGPRLYTVWLALVLALLGMAQYRGWTLTRANETRNDPRSVRDNPGAYRSSYYIPGRTLRGK
ncbi:MAG: hypothetical protein ACK6DR_15800 [Gemmatimonas sp.]|jgi:hypothetical protein|uniref:hypothetical protein n=1 Tax=Gemmatimonas sp. TaxID=1962908 RepID=UPI0022BBA988|nr:hypothetical protein [Gemmatimonas sp.]MCA2982929.1 hypothetical protein [Gemmatimonas sp.]MCA2989105.1 hypothetical protein [Gemmatimonas sp.]MCA2995875.1 hypothetical protein [Gemmatimonas sp.]MCE2953695.1 hypothetical protein [Gemmatimonas sp.]MCZ8010715.1 hypothetical protein [Gemmatimonas sp.]